MKQNTKKPTKQELEIFCQQLSQSGKMPSLLSLLPRYCDQYIPKSESGCLPKPLRTIFDKHFIEALYPELLEKCDKIHTELSVSVEQAKAVDRSTRHHSCSKIWFHYRAGRITASNFKDAIHADITKPSKSLIKVVCYSDSYQLKTPASQWGLEHEK